jgi:hypothetical protein
VLRDILFVYGQIHNTVRFPNLDLGPSWVPTRRAYRYSFSLIEWPPQQTIIFGASPTCSARALRRIENTRLELELINPPEDAFVDGRIIRSLQANLFAVLRDILF